MSYFKNIKMEDVGIFTKFAGFVFIISFIILLIGYDWDGDGGEDDGWDFHPAVSYFNDNGSQLHI